MEDDWKCNLLNVFCDWKFKSKGFLYPHFLGKISPVESDHVFLGSYPFDREYSYANYDEFSFHIKGSYGQHRECCEVKKCGIHFVHAQDSMESTKEEEEEEPHPKRPKYSTPSQLIIP